MANNKPLHVLIIGGGIAGPALALFLKKIGISCSVYEAYPYLEGIGGGFNIAPNGMNVLASLGLADKVIEYGTVASQSIFRNKQGKLLAKFINADPQKYGQPAVSLSRPTLYKILAEEMKRQNITIHYEKRLKTITEKEDGVIAYFQDGSKAEGDILIGADGVRSTVRNYILPNGPHPAYIGLIGVGGFVQLTRLPAMHQEEIQALTYVFGQNGFFGYGGADRGTLLWWSNLFQEKEFSSEELERLDKEKVQQELLTRFKDYQQPVESLIKNTTSLLRINIYDIQSLPIWHKGRTLLIGDSAHAVSPNAGQGASMALEDAMYLTKLLKDNTNYEKVFTQFEKDRKPRVEKIVAEGRKRGNDKKIVSPLEQKMREFMIRVFFNLFGSKGQDWLYNYKIDWR